MIKHFSIKRKRMLYVYFLLILIVILFPAIIFISRASPAFINIASKTAISEVNRIISLSAGEVFKESEIDIFHGTKDIKNETILAVNTAKLNILRSEFSERLINELEELATSYIYVPFGNIFENSLMLGVGIDIPIKVKYVSVPSVNIISDFKSSGINQVKYSITMTIAVDVSIITSYINITDTVKTDIPILENIIIGKIPSYYVPHNTYNNVKENNDE